MKLSWEPSLLTTRNSISPRRSSSTAGCVSSAIIHSALTEGEAHGGKYLFGEWDNAEGRFLKRAIFLQRNVSEQANSFLQDLSHLLLSQGNLCAPSCWPAAQTPG